jgi:hypothetical protein
MAGDRGAAGFVDRLGLVVDHRPLPHGVDAQGDGVADILCPTQDLSKMAAKKRAEARLARRVPYDLDKHEKLDPMALLEEVRACADLWPGGHA